MSLILDMNCTVCVCVCVCVLSCVQFFATLWTVACQASLSMEFSRQEYQIGLPFPNPGCLPDPGIEPVSLVSWALTGGFFTTEPPGKPYIGCCSCSASKSCGSLQPHTAHQVSCPLLSLRVCSLMSFELVMPANHLILCHCHSPPALHLSQH